MNALASTIPSPATAGGVLGTIVSWKVPAEVSFETLKTAMAVAGIDPDLALEMNPGDAITRALGEMRKGRVIRKLRHEDKKVFFQLTRENKDQHEITYERETEVCCATDTGQIACPDSDIKDRAEELLKAHMGKRLTGDLTRLVQRFYDKFDADLIPIREQGGAYFVPDLHREIVDKTRTLMSGIGGGLLTFEVRLGSGDTSASVAESMTEYLKQLIGDFKASCEDVDGASRKDVKARRRGTVIELRRKLELYKGLLGGYADTIEEQIKEADVELLRKLAQGVADDAKE